MSSSAPADLAPAFNLESMLRRWVQSPWLTASIICFSVLQQELGHMNCDTSWFMTFAEKVLDGATPYIDITDPNPPAAFLAYMPAILLSRVSGLPPDAMVLCLTFAGALLSIFFAGTVLKRSGLLRPEETMPALAAASFILLAVPAFCTAEREHIALILIFPLLALCAARAQGATLSLWLALLAGLAAGLSLSFKPYFVLPAGLAVLYAPLHRRDWHLLFTPENLMTGVVLGLYFLATVWFFPAYFTQALPLIRDVYVPAREQLHNILIVPGFLGNILLLVMLIYTVRERLTDPVLTDPRLAVLIAASLGFLVTFLIQSKGWMNHTYPGFALALLAMSFGLLVRNEATKRQRFAAGIFLPACLIAPLLFGARIDFGNIEEFPGVRAEVERLAPAHPKIAALAEELDLGHPLARQLGGTWIGRQNCLWVSYEVKYLLAGTRDEARRARLLAFMQADERMFAADVAGGKPDVLLVETSELESWARHEPAMSGLFDPYHLAGQAGTVSIWLRK